MRSSPYRRPGWRTSKNCYARRGWPRNSIAATLRIPSQSLLAIGDRHGNRVDLLGGLRGLDPEAFARTIAVPFAGITLRIIGREDFIAMKCFAGGPQDVADAEEALRTSDQRLELDLLRRVTRRFGRTAADALERLLAG